MSTRWKERLEMSARTAQLVVDLEPYRARVVDHRLYGAVEPGIALQRFMECHVFAVFDFMTLLKAMQAELTCVSLPWVPKHTASIRRFVNEIVLEEESDVIGNETVSHFEFYRDAMAQAGADTEPVQRFVDHVIMSGDPVVAASTAGLPEPIVRFVAGNWAIASSGRAAQIVGAFALGREHLIPAMFTRLQASPIQRPEAAGFMAYLTRHIDLDGEDHGPLAFALLDQLCGSSEALWREAHQAAAASLQLRAGLWDYTLERIVAGR